MTALETRILEFLQGQPRWYWWTRKELAVMLNRPKSILNPHDKRILEKLARNGMIEKRLQIVKTVKAEWQYRAK